MQRTWTRNHASEKLSLSLPQTIKLLDFHFSASNSVAVSGLGIGF